MDNSKYFRFLNHYLISERFPYKSENFQDLRFADGTLISKNQMPIVSHSAVEHVIEDDVVVDISNIANTEEVDDDTWETILNQDILNVR